jgi:Na+-transporting methylmalonyl-CoA/oxaloacetate decarboxylase gamma subunit
VKVPRPIKLLLVGAGSVLPLMLLLVVVGYLLAPLLRRWADLRSPAVRQTTAQARAPDEERTARD